MQANTLATWAAIVATVVGGGVFMGALASETKTNTNAIIAVQQQTDKLRDEGPPAIARLETQVAEVQKDIDEVKRSQDEILKELRKK